MKAAEIVQQMESLKQVQKFRSAEGADIASVTKEGYCSLESMIIDAERAKALGTWLTETFG